MVTVGTVVGAVGAVPMAVVAVVKVKQYVLLRETILNRTYGTHKNLYISIFLRTVFGPIYYGPP